MASDFVIVCQASVSGPSVAPCTDVAGQAFVPGVVERPALTLADAAALQSYAGPIDWAQAGDFFGFALGFVLVVYVVGFGIGQIFKIIRNT